jgi:hypothetical protein
MSQSVNYIFEKKKQLVVSRKVLHLFIFQQQQQQFVSLTDSIAKDKS